MHQSMFKESIFYFVLMYPILSTGNKGVNVGFLEKGYKKKKTEKEKRLCLLHITYTF